MLKISRTPILIILTVVSLSFILNAYPAFYRAQHTPENKWFTGQASWFDPWDLNLYISAVGYGQRGGLIFENLYDSESQEKLPVFLFYTILGKLFSAVNLSDVTLFYLSSVFTTLLLTSVLWWFSRLFLEAAEDRRVALLLALFGGGFGWAFFPRFFSADVNQPGFTLANALTRPHEGASLALFLLSLGYFWLYRAERKSNQRLKATFFLFLFLFFHPYNLASLVVIFATFGFYQWFKNGSLWLLSTLVGVALAGFSYYLVAGRFLLASPTFSGQVAQPQPSPSPLSSLAGWGILLPLALAAVIYRPRRVETQFLAFWFASQWLLTYLPVGIQKLLIRGLWVPTVLLAAIGLRKLSQARSWKYGHVALLVIFLSSLSSAYTFARRLTETTDNRWIYLDKNEGLALDYLRTHGKKGEGVLASYRLSNIIPARTDKKVWAGHEFQSPRFLERSAQVNDFYSGRLTEEEMVRLLQKADLQWIFFGTEEKELTTEKNWATRDFLEPAFRSGEVSLFRVRWERQ